ncbi:MAG: AMP-dependent synthetase [Actinomycetia bacterium]|nr:AMP-dependent synthetase [Actinomycetes bacterium]
MTGTTGRLTLADVLRGHARARPDGLAVADDAADVQLSWRAFDRRVNQAANALRENGVQAGDRVLWLGQNSFRLQELLLACAKVGAWFCPANWRQRSDELAFVIDDLNPSVVVWQREEVGDAVLAGRANAQRGEVARWLCHDDGEYEAFVATGTDDDPHGDAADTEPLLLIYTAAFDGHPNAAMLPHRALVGQGLLMAPWQGIDDTYVFLNSGPLFHIGTFMPNLSTFVMGGTNVFVPRSDGDALCRTISTYRCTGGFVVGPMVDAIAEAFRPDTHDLSSFRGKRGNATFDALVGSDTSPWGRRAGGYGQTEAMGMVTFNLLARDGIGTHGRPSPLVQLRVEDEHGNEVEAGEVGEIAVRGSTVMCGYWDRAELNAHRSRDGWHHTNDLGRFEADGTFTFVGPKSRMLKSGAENIYPAEVEGCLRRHPAVADVAVIGVPDDVWVQAVKAIVVPRADVTVDAEEVIAWCRERIASYKKPRSVEFVDSLPRLGFAVDYDALDERFGGGGYPGGSTRSV